MCSGYCLCSALISTPPPPPPPPPGAGNAIVSSHLPRLVQNCQSGVFCTMFSFGLHYSRVCPAMLKPLPVQCFAYQCQPPAPSPGARGAMNSSRLPSLLRLCPCGGVLCTICSIGLHYCRVCPAMLRLLPVQLIHHLRAHHRQGRVRLHVRQHGRGVYPHPPRPQGAQPGQDLRL